VLGAPPKPAGCGSPPSRVSPGSYGAGWRPGVISRPIRRRAAALGVQSAHRAALFRRGRPRAKPRPDDDRSSAADRARRSGRCGGGWPHQRQAASSGSARRSGTTPTSHRRSAAQAEARCRSATASCSRTRPEVGHASRNPEAAPVSWTVVGLGDYGSACRIRAAHAVGFGGKPHLHSL
jgi:hypothetical protein